MEYLVLARKWRPQVFEDVIAQDHVVRTLKNAIRFGRVAHAFIFSGPRGVGKTSVARILAKALNCAEGPAEIPCNQCPNCREVTDGISMDVHEIDGASNRGIDEIRELRESVKFSPSSSRYKIYIIDEVHMLTKEAFNALLKTLEEPPSHVIFIFATTETHKVPATILSRCQRFEFRRIPLKQLVNSLKDIARPEGIKISDTALGWIAQGAEGSLRDTLSIFDQVISFAGTDIQDKDVEVLLGVGDKLFLPQISRAVFDRNAAACLKIIEECFYTGLDMKVFYGMILNHFRNLLLVKITGGDGNLIDLPDHEIEELKKQAEPVSRETLQRLFDILMTEDEAMRKSLNPRFNLEFILTRMAYLEPLIPIDELLTKLEHIEKRLGSKREEQPAVAPPKHSVSFEKQEREKDHGDFKINEHVQEPPLDDLWERYKDHVKKKSQPLWSKIDPGNFLGYEKDCIRIGFPKGYIFLDDIKEESQIEKLTQISREFFQKDVTLKIEILESEAEKNHPKNGRNGTANGRTNEIRREALNHPLLQKIMDLFEGAEVREILIKENSH
jgi:DNA polymerase III subunit gamma/tau